MTNFINRTKELTEIEAHIKCLSVKEIFTKSFKHLSFIFFHYDSFGVNRKSNFSILFKHISYSTITYIYIQYKMIKIFSNIQLKNPANNTDY